MSNYLVSNPQNEIFSNYLYKIKNLIKQGLCLLEIFQNAAANPSWIPSSHTCAISSAALFITLDGRYDGSSQA